MTSSLFLVRACTSGEKVRTQASNYSMSIKRWIDHEETRKDWPYIVTLKMTLVIKKCMFA